MLKVLIADDESKIIQLIEKLIDWQQLDMELAATASNGIEALDMISRLKPDIAITDIRMPGIDGLDLIRQGKAVCPDMEFVIISGYRHFEYAQLAISYGVSAYLLKPIRKDELMSTLSGISEKFRKTENLLSDDERVRITMKSDEELLRTTFLSRLVYGQKITKKMELINRDYHYTFEQGMLLVGVIKADGHILDDKKNMKFIDGKAHELIDRNISPVSIENEAVTIDGFVYILVNYDSERQQIHKAFKNILDDLMIQESIMRGIHITIAVSSDATSFENIPKCIKEARLLIENRLVEGTGRIIENSITDDSGFVRTMQFGDFNRQMHVALESLDTSRIRNTIMKLKNDILSIPTITGHEIIQMTREVCNLYLYFLKNQRIEENNGFIEKYNAGADNCSDPQDLFDYLIKNIVVSYDKAILVKQQEESRPVRLAKEYMEKHFAEALTIETISGEVSLSPTYFSTLFKKNTGLTFLEYLSNIRMEMAKKLLKETSIPVCDISEKVGYIDTKYFTKTFMKYSGLKPREYRKLYS